MSTIISGFFQTQDEVQFAISELQRVGFTLGAISAFYVNPAGQHDLYPLGGDEDKSKGAKDTDAGVLAGASAGGVVGAAIGAATIPVSGPVGPVVGALVGGHVGTLIGALNTTKERNQAEQGGENTAPVRQAGMLVAVAVATPQQEDEALALLQSINADGIERSSGTIVDGDWADFDPLSEPHLITRVGPAV